MKTNNYYNEHIRKGLAETRYCRTIQKRIAELGMIYIRNISSAMEIAKTKEDYELLISAIVDFYNHEIEMLKFMCRKHNVSEENMALLFNGIGGEM